MRFAFMSSAALTSPPLPNSNPPLRWEKLFPLSSPAKGVDALRTGEFQTVIGLVAFDKQGERRGVGYAILTWDGGRLKSIRSAHLRIDPVLSLGEISFKTVPLQTTEDRQVALD